jgi:hypothetical protein
MNRKKTTREKNAWVERLYAKMKAVYKGATTMTTDRLEMFQFHLDQAAYECRNIRLDLSNEDSAYPEEEAQRLKFLENFITRVLNDAKAEGFTVADVETDKHFCRYILKEGKNNGF